MLVKILKHILDFLVSKYVEYVKKNNIKGRLK